MKAAQDWLNPLLTQTDPFLALPSSPTQGNSPIIKADFRLLQVVAPFAPHHPADVAFSSS